MSFALVFTRGNLGERDNAGEPDLLDPSPSLGDGGEQSLAALGFERRFCAGRVDDSLNGTKTRSRPRQSDSQSWGLSASGVIGAGVLRLNRSFAWDNKASLHRLRFDDHALYKPFDEVAIRNGGEVFPGLCKVLPDAVERCRRCDDPSYLRPPLRPYFYQCQREANDTQRCSEIICPPPTAATCGPFCGMPSMHPIKNRRQTSHPREREETLAGSPPTPLSGCTRNSSDGCQGIRSPASPATAPRTDTLPHRREA